MPAAAYLDTSAALKLLSRRSQTDALDDFLADWPVRASSQLLRIAAALGWRVKQPGAQ